MLNLVSFSYGRILTGRFAGVRPKVVIVNSVLKINVNTFFYIIELVLRAVRKYQNIFI